MKPKPYSPTKNRHVLPRPFKKLAENDPGRLDPLDLPIRPLTKKEKDQILSAIARVKCRSPSLHP
jgi:hypothetical protein